MIGNFLAGIHSPPRGCERERADRSRCLGNRHSLTLAATILAVMLVVVTAFAAPSASPPPNIIIILADDLGYGDLGGVWGGSAHTPHLERLAREGLRFTDFHSNGAMCTPTRASLLTGRYPLRMGFERAYANPGREWRGLASPGISEITIATYLRNAGYATAMFGKWHLGKHPSANPIRFGFDEFRGLTDGDSDYFSKLDRFGGPDWLHNEELEFQPGYATHVTTESAVDFIYRNRERPFFLYVPHLAVHFPWVTPDDGAGEIRQLGEDFTSGKPGPRSKLGPHGPDEIPGVMRRMIEELDLGVGRIMDALHQSGLDRSTLVLFTSDNGAYIHYMDPDFVDPAAKVTPKPDWPQVGSNGPLRGQKTQLWEGGHRVPAIAWWPGRIPAGSVTHETVMTMDVLPTALELAGVTPPPPGGPNALDGVSLVPLLLRGEPLAPRTLFWKAPTQRAVRQGPWKMVNDELFNLAEDIGETRNLASSHSALARSLQAKLDDWEKRMTRK